MELREYLKILGKRIWLFIVTVLIVLLGTYFFTVIQAEKFSGSLCINTIVTSQEEHYAKGTFYQYDNYYIFRSNESFADTVVSWLKDPANVITIFDQANEQLPQTTLKKYSRIIDAKKVPPATIQITMKSEDEEYVRSIINSVKNFVEDKTEKYIDKDLINDITLDI